MEDIMAIRNGLTTWVLRVGPQCVMWRWNMPLRQAMHTFRRKTFGEHGYIAAGPLVVEW
jgi:hypothetical protein